MNSDENYLHIIFYCDEQRRNASEKNDVKKHVIACAALGTRTRAAEARHTTTTQTHIHRMREFIYEPSTTQQTTMILLRDTQLLVCKIVDNFEMKSEIWSSNCALRAITMHTAQTPLTDGWRWVLGTFCDNFLANWQRQCRCALCRRRHRRRHPHNHSPAFCRNDDEETLHICDRAKHYVRTSQNPIKFTVEIYVIIFWRWQTR